MGMLSFRMFRKYHWLFTQELLLVWYSGHHMGAWDQTQLSFMQSKLPALCSPIDGDFLKKWNDSIGNCDFWKSPRRLRAQQQILFAL